MNDRNLAIQISKHPLIKKLLETKMATSSEVARLIVMEMRTKELSYEEIEQRAINRVLVYTAAQLVNSTMTKPFSKHTRRCLKIQL